MDVKKTFSHAVSLVAFAAVVTGGVRLWQVRPWRVIARVNGHAITARELDLRARTLMNDAKRTQHIYIPKTRERQALENFRRQATQTWILKEVLLSEALARGYEVTGADEKESLAQMTARLKSRNLSPEAFFKEGPLPEALKKQDFREGVLINKFTAKEVRDKINVTPQEIDAWQAQLQRAALLQTKGSTNQMPERVTRKYAIDSLRALRFREGFRKLFRELYPKAQVSCPEYPEMESLEGVSPTRREDLVPTSALATVQVPTEGPAADTPAANTPAAKQTDKSAPAAKPAAAEKKEVPQQEAGK